MSVVFTMAMCPVDLKIIICHPTVMLNPHVFPRFRFFEVIISHASLYIDYVELTLGRMKVVDHVSVPF